MKTTKPKETPAEKMHNRILNGSAFSTRGVTSEAFEAIARRSGTRDLPDIKRALERLKNIEQ